MGESQKQTGQKDKYEIAQPRCWYRSEQAVNHSRSSPRARQNRVDCPSKRLLQRYTKGQLSPIWDSSNLHCADAHGVSPVRRRGVGSLVAVALKFLLKIVKLIVRENFHLNKFRSRRLTARINSSSFSCITLASRFCVFE